MGSDDDQKAGIECRDKDKQQRSTTIRAGRHSSDKVAKQCTRSRGDRSKSQSSLNRHQIANDPSSDPSSSDSGSSSSSSSGGGRKRTKNKTKHYERKPHKTRSAPVKTKVYKCKQGSSSSSESAEASEVEQVMTTRVSDIQLRDFHPQGCEEWLTRAINYLRSYPDISEATRFNLYKKLPTEDRILLDMMRGTATLEKAKEVLRKKYASSQMSDVQVALSGMNLASNELPSEMLRKTLQKAHLSVPIMNKGLYMLVKVLFLKALPPEVRLKFSGYSGTTKQLMNEADSYIITLRQEKQHKLPVPVATIKQDLAASEQGNPYKVGALSVLQALLSEEESSINRKLRTATNSRQANSDNEEHGSRAEHCDGNERSRHQYWDYRQNDRHSSSRRHYDTHKQSHERGQRPHYDSRQTSGQPMRCYECQRMGHVASFCPSRSTQSNSQGNQWHTPQWKQCYEDQQRQLRQLQAQVAHQFEGPQGKISKNVQAGPFYVVHCVNTSMKFLIDTGAAISLLPDRNVPIGVTVQHFDIAIEGISGQTQCAVGKVDLKIQPELSGKVCNLQRSE